MTKFTIPAVIRNCALSLMMIGVAYPVSAEIKAPLGVAAPDTSAAREIKINSATKHVNVTRQETVRFVNTDNGRSFTWQFYTLNHPTTDIRKIAPSQFTDREVLIYISPSADELN